MKKEKILVGLSGGVDSAVAAALLLEQGYEVVGGFMKNYVSEKGNCTTHKDAEEAIRVANHLGIELLSFDLQQEYQEKIIDYIFDGYQKGITPNPDVLCNSLIKFDVFLHKALEMGFDKIATGHYARIVENKDSSLRSEGPATPSFGVSCKGNEESLSITHLLSVPKDSSPSVQNDKKTSFGMSGKGNEESHTGPYILLRGKDYNKDQSYFLAGLNQFQLSKSLFPLGGYEKNEVRELAKNFTLPNADRKDSQGLCFIGNVPIREFLLQRFDKKEGDIVYLNSFDATEGKKVGTHQGAYFYTIGQKHGLGLNFKAYVYRIDIEHNILYVTDKDNEELKSKTLIARDWHWILSPSSSFIKGVGKIRYRQNPPVDCTLEEMEDGKMKVLFDEEQRAIAPGQVFVAYDGEICLGCGTIE